MYFGRHFAWYKYFTYHPVLVLSPNYKQQILSPAKIRKICYSLAELCQISLFEFNRVEGGVKLMKHFTGGASYKSLVTSAT
jgi:hypothetical protein